MRQDNLGQQPIQRSFHGVKNAYEEIREAVQLQMRGAALSLVSELFTEEVERCCGPSHSRKGNGRIYRGGSEAGSISLAGQRISVRRPRVKSEHGEEELTSYSALQHFDLLCERVMKHMISGVSTRDYDGLLDEVAGGMGLKKSSVSKAFIQGSRQALDDINGRDLSGHKFTCTLIDGIEFGDRMVVAAMGITFQGEKLILGLRE